ncbi:MinD/ParA family ATP-binding protein [Actinomadura terrae]|uniref:MinD/ParA family ATP-binding protein n=1 Tax=Actinomadura terrae TaxID=604353 RepID=UPI001FA7DCA4|nr:MinD/ParA family protein [Actinomadura terrae]
MTDRDWQRAVLHDLGGLESGLVPPSPRPAGQAAPPVPPRVESPWTAALAASQPPPPAPAAPQAPAPVAHSAPDPRPQEPAENTPVQESVPVEQPRRVSARNPGGPSMDWVTAQIGAPVPSCRRIAVTSVRGGAGKSTIAALVAGIVRRYRADRVVAVDADPGLGSLPLRVGASSPSSLRHLAAARPRSWDETAAHLGRTDEGLYVLPAAPGGAVSGPLDHHLFHQGVGNLSRYFSTAVIDCGAGVSEELQRGILSGAHAQVFVTPGTVDGALSARAAINWFVQSNYTDLLHRTVIALVAHAPNPGMDVKRAVQMLSAGGLPVVYIPFDRHLAAGMSIAPERVGAAAHTAAVQMTAAAFARSLAVR